jgi:hypothetical protein
VVISSVSGREIDFAAGAYGAFKAARMRSRGQIEMGQLPDTTVIFGHGIWFALLTWLLLGHRAEDADSMRRFRRFQLDVPIPNGAVFQLTPTGAAGWSVQPNL